MAAGNKDRETREARDRARLYRARQEFHESLSARRRRDNLIAGIVGGLVILAAVGAQVAYFTAGPGAPEPTPSPSVSESSAPSDTETPAVPEPTPAESTVAP